MKQRHDRPKEEEGRQPEVPEEEREVRWREPADERGVARVERSREEADHVALERRSRRAVAAAHAAAVRAAKQRGRAESGGSSSSGSNSAHLGSSNALGSIQAQRSRSRVVSSAVVGKDSQDVAEHAETCQRDRTAGRQQQHTLGDLAVARSQ